MKRLTSLTFFPPSRAIPGRFAIERGTARDYRRLAQFHYRSNPPAIWARVWVVRYLAPSDAAQSASLRRAVNHPRGPRRGRVVAVAVVSYPIATCRARRAALGISPADELSFVNRHVRTISRIIVHPQFRGLGLAVRLLRWTCLTSPTRYLEAHARMGRAHPLFERAGMHRIEAAAASRSAAVYYLFDRRGLRPATLDRAPPSPPPPRPPPPPPLGCLPGAGALPPANSIPSDPHPSFQQESSCPDANATRATTGRSPRDSASSSSSVPALSRPYRKSWRT